MSVRTALITGTSRGIGAAIKQLFVEKGIEILSPGRDEMDLSISASVDNYLAALGDRRVDILVNNAGINPLGSISELSDEDMEAAISINLESPLRLLRALVPRMADNSYGRVVNLSSIWSEVSKPRRVIYSATKAALSAATRSIAIEVAEAGVLVNAVAPGYTDTELTRQNNSPEAIAAIEQIIPQKRLAQPREIAELVYFLSSEQNTYLTGQTILIDGGYTCL